MKNHTLRLSLMAISAVLFLGSCQKENINALSGPNDQPASGSNLKAGKSPVAGTSASGQGTLTLNDKFQHFAFHAKKSATGEVSGSFETHSPGQNLDVHGTVVCLNVVGNSAVVTAQVTRINDDNTWGVVVGGFIAFRVVDNGEGSKAPSDQFSDYFFSGGYQWDCNAPVLQTLGLYTIEGGNIQVK